MTLPITNVAAATAAITGAISTLIAGKAAMNTRKSAAKPPALAPTAMKAQNQAFPLNLEHDVTVGHFWYLFPNTVFGQFPGVPGFYISRFDPLFPDRTSRVTTSLIPQEMPDPDAHNISEHAMRYFHDLHLDAMGTDGA